MKRWIIRILFLLLLMACALPWLLPRLAEKVLLRILRQRGLPEVVLNIQRITPWQTVLGPVRFGGGGDSPQAQTIVLRYSSKSIWHRQLTAVEITGMEMTVVEVDGKWQICLPQMAGGGAASAASAMPTSSTTSIMSTASTTSAAPAVASSENVRIPLLQLAIAQGRIRVVFRGMTVMIPVSGQLDLGDGRLRFTADLQPRDEDFHAAGEFAGLNSDQALDWRTLTGCAEINGNLHPERWQDLLQSRFPDLPIIGPELQLAIAADFRQGVPAVSASIKNSPAAGLLRVQAPAGQAGLKTFKLDVTLPAGRREVQAKLEMDLRQAQIGSLNLAAIGDEALLSSSAEFKLNLADFALQGTGSFILSPTVVPVLLPGLTLAASQDPAQLTSPISGTFSGNFTPGAAGRGEYQAQVTIPTTAYHFQQPDLTLAGECSAALTLNGGLNGLAKGSGEIKMAKLNGVSGGVRVSVADLALAATLEQSAGGGLTFTGSGDYKLASLAGTFGTATIAFADSANSPAPAKPDNGTFSGSFTTTAGNLGEYQAKVTLPVVPFHIKQPDLDLTGKVSAAVTLDGRTSGYRHHDMPAEAGTPSRSVLLAEQDEPVPTGTLKGSSEFKVTDLIGTAQGARFAAAEFALSTDLTTATIAGSLAETIRNAAVNGRLRFTGGDFSQSAAGISVGGITGGLPFVWSGKNGFSAVKPETAAAAVSTLSFERCEGRGISLKPAQFPLRWNAAGRLTFSGTLALANVPVTVELQSAAMGWRNGLEATATAIVPQFHLTPEFPLLKETLAKIKGLSFSANAGGKAMLDYRANKLQVQVIAEIANGTVSLPDKKLEITGISGTIELPALPELRTAPHQKLLFTSALLGGLPVDGGSLEYQIESPEALFIDQATLAWCGGLVRGYAVHVNPQQGDFDLTLYAENIQMERLLGLFRSVQGKASGNLYGRLPVSFKAGRFKFKDGFLYAVPGLAGTLALTQPGWLTASLGQSGADPKTVKQVEAALSDLEFSQFRIDFTGEGGGESLLRFMIIGASRKDKTLPPLNLNINVRSPLEQLFNLGLHLGQ